MSLLSRRKVVKASFIVKEYGVKKNSFVPILSSNKGIRADVSLPRAEKGAVRPFQTLHLVACSIVIVVKTGHDRKTDLDFFAGEPLASSACGSRKHCTDAIMSQIAKRKSRQCDVTLSGTLTSRSSWHRCGLRYQTNLDGN